MKQNLKIEARQPIYKQIVEHYESAIISGELKPGEKVPSMNELATELSISKETAKNAYKILTGKGLFEARHGKGFFVSSRGTDANLKILVLVDVLSPYRQAFINAFSAAIGKKAELMIQIHNQDVALLKYYLDGMLGKYDYYIVTPHFPLDDDTHREAIRQLNRIPKLQLILADHLVDDLRGHFGAVYQDFRHDAASALETVVGSVGEFRRLDVFRMPNSLYGGMIQESIQDFCGSHGIEALFHESITKGNIRKNQLCLLLNSQADLALFEINGIAQEKGLNIGKDIHIISYNDTPICGLIFGGLSTMSSDFEMMGRECARMIREGHMEKIHCDFRLIRRRTF